MSSKNIKLTTLATSLLMAFGAQSAIYDVYEYAPEGASVKTYGQAIAPSASGENCWTTTSCSQATYKMAAEVRDFPEGFSNRNESPFGIAIGYRYLNGGWEGFRDYCRSNFNYADAFCDTYATENYTNGYAKEVAGDQTGNIAYVEGGNGSVSTKSAVITGLYSGNKAYGHKHGVTTGVRNTAYDSDSGNLTAPASTTDLYQTQVFSRYDADEAGAGTGPTLFVGSLSRNNAGQSYERTSKAAVWVDNAAPVEVSWSSAAARDNVMPQGSMRDVVKLGSKYYGVGYNSDSDERLRASIFSIDEAPSDWAAWTTNFVAVQYDVNQYSNSELTAVNKHGTAIGNGKLNIAVNGSYANTLFYVSDVTSASPTCTNFSGDIFFTGVNATAGAINNNDEVVGQIDYERHAESRGKPRAHRGFIAPIISANNKAPLNSRGWYLDDLTNGGAVSESNNQYRIFDATDINDAGVISATAYKCAGGYSTLAVNATCNGTEQIVAVKLVPKQNVTSANIQTRPVVTQTVERQGGSFSMAWIFLLGVLGFRRK
ncbi:DUF3466 family protein [Vibrio sonorensis]|uniref:DUF3466 family protein n=1 Tax=Vibrio sonorensis TaxID=1004316 RepID=UPI0008D99213|nr:DUF3466 family protein [Vibrio sonorensis]